MKIALITPYKNFPGGVESVNKILIEIFKEANHQVYLVTTDNYKISFLDKIFIKFIGLPYITMKKFEKIQDSFDVIIANGEFGFGINYPKTINLFHGSYKGLRDFLKKQYNFKQYLGLTKNAYIQKLSAKDKYVVAVSEFVKNILERDGIKVNEVIPNCIDTDKFRPMNTGKNDKFIFVGSYNYYAKGFDILEKLADKGFKIACVTNKKPGQRLKYLGNINNEDMPKIYNQYKILIFPSRFEGMPMVPLEAMACGLPIVMSNVGLGPELKKKMPEFVVDEWDEKSFIQKIKLIENNYEYYSKKAREYVLKYHSFDIYKKKWLNLIQRVANA
ncbi:glycosyltransferase family 4 protein [Hippea jasoniae]|uniref:glycosyltransferase family 4 protein n=1 Tax=Hippea jasoniae TaxID=944479 RepID=UPI00054E1275|nr:glycosyltransferase family 4 protein [Hippea jasoniae]